MGKAKQINIKNRTYYFYNNMINLKSFKINLLKIDKKKITGGLIFTTLVTLLLRKLMIVTVSTV